MDILKLFHSKLINTSGSTSHGEQEAVAYLGKLGVQDTGPSPLCFQVTFPIFQPRFHIILQPVHHNITPFHLMLILSKFSWFSNSKRIQLNVNPFRAWAIFKRQNPTSAGVRFWRLDTEDGPRTERNKICKWSLTHNITNEAEGAN